MRARILAIILFIIVAWLSVLVQLSFINTLPGVWNHLNPLLLGLVFVLFFFGLEAALVFAAALGFFLDIYSFVPFGFNLFVLLLTVFLLHLLLLNWLTNRSFYSFVVLALVGVLLSNIIPALVVLIFSALGPDKLIFWLAGFDFWHSLFWQLSGSLVLSLVFFNLMNLVGRQLKPFFLTKS